jgi:hypothetical protein
MIVEEIRAAVSALRSLPDAREAGRLGKEALTQR